MRVMASPFSVQPTTLCQKHDTPMPAMGRPRSTASARRWCSASVMHARTAPSSAPGSISDMPSREVSNGYS